MLIGDRGDWVACLLCERENMSALTEDHLGLYLVNWGEDGTLEFIF